MLKIAIIVGRRAPAARPTRLRAGCSTLPPGAVTLRSRSSTLPTSSCRCSTRPCRRRWASIRSRTPRPGRRRSRGFDAFVFVTPEYNHSMSGALKNAIDFLFREWNDKAAGFVSYGSVGGARAVEQLRLVMGELKVADVRAQCRSVAVHRFREFHDVQAAAAAGSGGRGDAGRPDPLGPRAAGDAARSQREMNAMTTVIQPSAIEQRPRAIADRTFGDRRGPISRLMSPSGLGRRLKPFVFLDLFDAGGSDLSGFGWHPHSGIATLTYLWQGSTRYEDTTGAAGLLPAGGVEWFKAAGGAWHGGGSGNSGRSRGFQLWLALPPSEELDPSESIYLSPEETPSAGAVSVLLGSFGGVDSPLKAPSPINYLAVHLKAGETWRYEPPASHDVAWLALASGSLAVPEPVAAGELVAFDKSNHPIDVRTETDSEFVLGSAASHPHDLVLGYYSVHTSPDALDTAERRIAEIQARLREEGVL